MADTPESGTTSGPQWLLPPNVPPGLKVSLNSVIDAQRLTPEVLDLLAKLLAATQTANFNERNASCIKDSCPSLGSCVSYDAHGGGCGSLVSCGTFLPVIESAE